MMLVQFAEELSFFSAVCLLVYPSSPPNIKTGLKKLEGRGRERGGDMEGERSFSDEQDTEMLEVMYRGRLKGGPQVA